MKKILIIMFISLSTFVVQAQNTSSEFKGTVKIEVDGLSCPFCAYGLEKKLKEVDGVQTIEIDVENAFVMLVISEGKSVKEEIIRKNIKDAGFTPRSITEESDE